MKKLVFAFIATVAMTMAACGGQTSSEKVVNDSDSVAVDSIEVVDSVDSVGVDSIVVE